MKIRKLKARLARLRQVPGDAETLERILRMVGDELPRFRKDILDETRSRLSTEAAILADRDDKDAILTSKALQAACSLIASYQIAAANRHCGFCHDPLLDYFDLQVPRHTGRVFRLCPTCIRERTDAALPDHGTAIDHFIRRPEVESLDLPGGKDSVPIGLTRGTFRHRR